MSAHRTLVHALVVAPPRLTFGGFCLYCGQQGCESARCIALYAASRWTLCDECNGSTTKPDTDSEPCGCAFGVMEASASTVDAVSPDPLPIAPISAPPVFVSAPLPRCLTCGHRTATPHTDCAAPLGSVWTPCPDCAGRRTDADGFECQLCCGVGFIALEATDTLAARAGEVTAQW